MKNVCIILFLLVSIVMQIEASEAVDKVAVKRSVAELFHRYPEATLRDVYKSCFQDRFGMTHILADRSRVEYYIVAELNEDDYLPDSVYYESCGWQGNYVRVSLRAIKDGIITLDQLVDAFMASAPDTVPSVTQQWIDEWEAILSIVRDIKPELQNIETDAESIRQLLNRGEYVMHHSRRYNECYHPHYRIIRRDIFETQLLLKLSK